MKIRNTKDLERARTAEVADDANPVYLFSTTWTELLVSIANGDVDAQLLAKAQLASRGLDKRGLWVGHDKAAKIHGV